MLCEAHDKARKEKEETLKQSRITLGAMPGGLIPNVRFQTAFMGLRESDLFSHIAPWFSHAGELNPEINIRMGALRAWKRWLLNIPRDTSRGTIQCQWLSARASQNKIVLYIHHPQKRLIPTMGMYKEPDMEKPTKTLFRILLTPIKKHYRGAKLTKR